MQLLSIAGKATSIYGAIPSSMCGTMPGTPIERLNHTKQVVHIPDLRNHQSYIQRNERIVPLVETGGARTS